jgi:uncharacterized damage-inducible protein DinB
MIVETVKTLLARDLHKLKTEIESYHDESKLWYIEKNIANSGGNLCLHLVGNLNTYIGAVIGKTNYIRNRDLEFSLKDIPKAELISRITDTMAVVDHALSLLTDEDLRSEYPLLVLDEKTSTGFLLVHLTTHLAYHLGQINYHRRLLQ